MLKDALRKTNDYFFGEEEFDLDFLWFYGSVAIVATIGIFAFVLNFMGM